MPYRDNIVKYIICKTGSIQHIKMPSEDNRAMDTVNMHKKFSKARRCGFRDMRADRQTDRETYSSQYTATRFYALSTGKHDIILIYILTKYR